MSLVVSGSAFELEQLNEPWRWVQFSARDGLPSQTILDLVETSEGVVWVCTAREAAWFDGFRWQSAADAGLPPGTISQLAAGHRGEVLIVVGEQLYRGNEKGFRRFPVVVSGEEVSVWTVAAAGGELLIIYTRQGEIVELRDGEAVWGTAPPHPASGELQTTSRNVYLTSGMGTYRYQVGQWIRWHDERIGTIRESATRGIGFRRADSDQLGVLTWTGNGAASLTQGRPLPRVRAVTLDRTGVALAVHRDGRVRVKEDSGDWTDLRMAPPPLRQATNLRVTTNGDLWVATPEGLALCRAVRRWREVIPAGDEALEVQSLLMTRQDELWAGTSRGIMIRDSAGRIRVIDQIDGTPMRIITALAEDRNGHIWVGSGSGFAGAYRWDGERWTQFGAEEGLTAPRVHRITADRQGRLWFLGMAAAAPGVRPDEEPGAFVLHGSRFEHWGSDKGLPAQRLYDLATDDAGSLWFATRAGLSRWRAGQWMHWARADGLRYRRVFEIAIGAGGNVWFTYGQPRGLGVVRADGVISHLTSEDGLAHDRAQGLARAADGSLWVTTSGGLNRYADGVLASFTNEHGMPFHVAWPLLPVVDTLYIGTTGAGVVALSLEEAAHPAPLVEIETPLQGERQILFRWEAYPYWGELPPGRVRTRYRVDDEPWSPWSRRREAAVVGAGWGGHRFQVQSSSLFGNVSTEPALVSFAFPAPWYLRTVPLSFGAAWLVTLIAAGVWYRRRQRLQREELQRQSAASLRLKSLGALAGGIAHDFNNLLTVILGYTEFVKQDPRNPEESLAAIEEAGNRAVELTRQLLAFSRQQSVKPRVVDPTDLLMAVDKMLRRVIGEDIELVTVPTPEIPRIRVDPGEFDRVILNLAINARDAMPNGGRLTMETASVELHRGAGPLHPDAKPGPFVRLTLSDTGTGISRENLNRVFEPFFTTKGQGSGLGLASSYGIIRQAGGFIDVKSEAGNGTSFELYFPAVFEEQDTGEEKISRTDLRGSESILVVEDEPKVLDFVVESLRQLGYRVCSAASPTEALAMVRNQLSLDLIVSDVVMPQMSGPQLVEKLRRERPNLRVLFVSGYSPRTPITEDGYTAFLAKPFTVDALASAVRDILDRHSLPSSVFAPTRRRGIADEPLA